MNYFLCSIKTTWVNNIKTGMSISECLEIYFEKHLKQQPKFIGNNSISHIETINKIIESVDMWGGIEIRQPRHSWVYRQLGDFTLGHGPVWGSASWGKCQLGEVPVGDFNQSDFLGTTFIPIHSYLMNATYGHYF